MPAGLVTAPHEDITYQIIGAAYDVHNRLGPGEREFIYRRAMEDELHKKRLNFAPEVPVEVYDGDTLLGYYIPDLIIEEKVVVELKAVSALEPTHLAQVITYLNHLQLPIGLLLNFGQIKLNKRRVFPSQQAVDWNTRRSFVWVPDKLKNSQHR